MKMALFHLLLQIKLLLPPKYFVVYAATVKVRINSVLPVDARKDEFLVACIANAKDYARIPLLQMDQKMIAM